MSYNKIQGVLDYYAGSGVRDPAGLELGAPERRLHAAVPSPLRGRPLRQAVSV